MRRLTHLLLSPPSRFVRLLLGEKRLSYDSIAPEDPHAHLPVFEDEDGTRCTGIWAIVDQLEGAYEDNPMVPEDADQRGEALRLLDWAMGPLHDSVTRKVVYEKAGQRVTGALGGQAPSMETVRQGREALKPALKLLGDTADRHGYLVARDCTLGDLAVAAHLSALDYFGEVPWKDFPSAAEWYLRIKSRPSFRALLADRVPGQPPVSHYGQLDD